MERQLLIGQFARFAAAGAVAALIYAIIYLLFADHILAPGFAALGVIPSFLVASSIGFLLHSRWSFAGHGSRTAGATQPLRFAVSQIGGMGLNMLWTYVVTVPLGCPNWMALIPCVTLTPVATFAVQRWWVFSD